MEAITNQLLKIPKKRLSFHIMREVQQLSSIMPNLPENEVYKVISNGHFSSIAFVKLVADCAKIHKLTASSLRIGKKHLMVLDNLHQQGRLDKADFVVGSIMKNDSETGKKYGYYDSLTAICKKNAWRCFVCNNHSKIILFDTERGKYVLETSSNLNENPSIEHFSFEKSAELYDAYMGMFGLFFERSAEITNGENNG